jgi:hypothetical protein
VVRDADPQFIDQLIDGPLPSVSVPHTPEAEDEVVEISPPLHPHPTAVPQPAPPAVVEEARPSGWKGAVVETDEVTSTNPTCLVCRLQKEGALLLFLPCRHQRLLRGVLGSRAGETASSAAEEGESHPPAVL